MIELGKKIHAAWQKERKRETMYEFYYCHTLSNKLPSFFDNTRYARPKVFLIIVIRSISNSVWVEKGMGEQCV